MDRGNGGSPEAPPRPPKLFARAQRTADTTDTTTLATAVHASASIPPAIPHRIKKLNDLNSSSSSSPQINPWSITTPRQTTINVTKSSTSNEKNNNNNNINNNSKHISDSSSSHSSSSNESINHNSNSNSKSKNNCNINNNHVFGDLAVISRNNIDLEGNSKMQPTATYLPQRLTASNGNKSPVQTNSQPLPGGRFIVTNSFTRRQPSTEVKPVLAVAAAATATAPTTAANSAGLLRAPGGPVSVNGNEYNLLSQFRSGQVSRLAFLPPPAAAQHQSQENSSPPASPVSLTQPRPVTERLRNEYVDTPRTQHPAGQQDTGQTTTTHHLLSLPAAHHSQIHLISSGSGCSRRPNSPELATSTTAAQHARQCPASRSKSTCQPPACLFSNWARPGAGTASTQQPAPITKQPVLSKQPSATFEGRLQLANRFYPNATTTTTTTAVGDIEPVKPITCEYCGKCRCQNCRMRRKIPEKWLCGNHCLCSTEACVDYCSCLCCAKALFHYCDADSEDCDASASAASRVSPSCSENPCSCMPEKRVLRWLCLGLMSTVLPCMLLYWPCRCLTTSCEACYAYRKMRNGCRCYKRDYMMGSASMLSSNNSDRVSIVEAVECSGGRGRGAPNMRSGVGIGIGAAGARTGEDVLPEKTFSSEAPPGGLRNANNSRTPRKSVSNCQPTPEKQLLDLSSEM